MTGWKTDHEWRRISHHTEWFLHMSHVTPPGKPTNTWLEYGPRLDWRCLFYGFDGDIPAIAMLEGSCRGFFVTSDLRIPKLKTAMWTASAPVTWRVLVIFFVSHPGGYCRVLMGSFCSPTKTTIWRKRPPRKRTWQAGKSTKFDRCII